MKRFLAVLILAALIFSLVGCGSGTLNEDREKSTLYGYVQFDGKIIAQGVVDGYTQTSSGNMYVEIEGTVYYTSMVNILMIKRNG